MKTELLANGAAVATANPLPVGVEGGNTTPVITRESAEAAAVVVHRDAVAAPDVVGAITISAAKSATAGTMAAAATYVAVVPWNRYGPAVRSNVVEITPDLNNSIDVTIPQAAGATHYEIGMCGCADTHWVATITEAQRAAGCAITAEGTIGAGGSAGVVNVQVLAASGHALTGALYATNQAIRPESVLHVDCSGYRTALVGITLARTDINAPITASPSCTLLPFTLVGGAYQAAAPETIAALAGAGAPLAQGYELAVGGTPALVFVVAAVAAGWSVTVAVQRVT